VEDIDPHTEYFLYNPEAEGHDQGQGVAMTGHELIHSLVLTDDNELSLATGQNEQQDLQLTFRWPEASPVGGISFSKIKGGIAKGFDKVKNNEKVKAAYAAAKTAGKAKLDAAKAAGKAKMAAGKDALVAKGKNAVQKGKAGLTSAVKNPKQTLQKAKAKAVVLTKKKPAAEAEAEAAEATEEPPAEAE
jgi:hypothetical protein